MVDYKYYLKKYSIIELFGFFKYRFYPKKYIYKSKQNKMWAYISYLPEAFYRITDDRFMNTHQNKREALVIGDIFARHGYNYIVELYNVKSDVNNVKFDIVFGLEPNFCVQTERNPQALKIYYATGSYSKYQNEMIKKRTDAFNQKHDVSVKYQRLVEDHNAYELADYIFQIGSNYTIKTYPDKYKNKISLIDQSSNLNTSIDVNSKLASYEKTNFIWLGGAGCILKGLDLVLDFFLAHPQYTLHVFGNIETDFFTIYKNELKNSNNIIFYGFMDLNAQTFLDVAARVTFSLFPSASEGGAPGALISCMKCGIIPIASESSSFDGIEELGYKMDALTYKGLEGAINLALKLETDNLEYLMLKNIAYSNSKWNLEKFAERLDELLTNKVKLYNEV